MDHWLSYGVLRMYILNQEHLTIPKEQIEALFFLRFTRRAEEILDQDFADAIPFTEPGKRLVFFRLFKQLVQMSKSVCDDVKKEYMTAENAVLAWDIQLATKEEKVKAAKKLLEELENTDGNVLYQKAPLLKKWLDQHMQRFIEATREMLGRITADQQSICRAFFKGKDLEAVTLVTTDGADLHFHGRSTCVIQTKAGKFVYKPHDCGIDVGFQEIAQRYFSDFLTVPKCLQRPGYGYCEYIESRPVNSEEEVDGYFYRLGGAIALFQALGSSDMHSENWIAQGDRPAVIDLETILTPVPKVFSHPKVHPQPIAEQEDFLYDANRSLIPSSILPRKVGDRQLSVLLDDSEIVSCLPMLEGVRQSVIGHEQRLYAGFDAGYDRCMEVQKELLKAVEAFREHPVRRLLRQSNYYALLQQKMLTTAALQSEESQKAVVNRLKDYFVQHGAKQMEPIAEWEKECLLEGDIPYFCTKGGSHALCGYDHVLIPGFFKTSGVENACQRLTRLSQTEKKFELGILKQSLDAALLPAPKERAEALYHYTFPDASPITEEEAILEAEEIFRNLDAMSLSGPSGKTSWLMRCGEGRDLSPARPTMSQGTLGLGVFFSAIAAISQKAELKKRAIELSMICLDQVSDAIGLLEKNSVIPESVFPLGITSGFAGVLRSLTLIERYLDSPIPGQLAQRLLLLLDKSPIEEAEYLDVFSGVAGLLLALCGQPANRNTDVLQRQIRRTADRLLAKKKPLEQGGFPLWDTLNLGRPISGAGHGMAGIAAALLGAARALEDNTYVPAAADALTYEHRTYSEKLGTWPDLRKSSVVSHAMHGLCSGAPGIGLALLYCGKMGTALPTVNRVWLEEDISRALEACLHHQPLFRDHLCCGNSSAAAFYLGASQAVADKQSICREAAGILLAKMKKRKDLEGGYTYLPSTFRQFFTPDLFYGGAGIGYEMLQFAKPEQIIPILF